MKKIAVITGTRAEYGLLKPLLHAINEDADFELQLIVTGMHLSPQFGETFKTIEADGFHISEKVDCKLTEDSSEAISKSIGSAIIGFAEAYNKLNPELIIVLGDRSEIFAASTAATVKGIPIAHIHGGETTEGAYDEAFRHSITKMSYWHFTSTEVYKQRVIQLGEQPNRVFNVGAIGIDSINSVELLDSTAFEESIKCKLKQKNILITFHPVTLENETAEHQFQELLNALDTLEDTFLIFTKPNSDKDGHIIIKMINEYVERNKEKAVEFASLGQLRYLSALQFMDAVVGNSSSGILEVPSFNKPTINIGDRQKGRLMSESVINCEPEKDAILNALNKAFSESFKIKIKNQNGLYGDGNATKQILEVLKNNKIETLKKSFYDLK